MVAAARHWNGVRLADGKELRVKRKWRQDGRLLVLRHEGRRLGQLEVLLLEVEAGALRLVARVTCKGKRLGQAKEADQH